MHVRLSTRHGAVVSGVAQAEQRIERGVSLNPEPLYATSKGVRRQRGDALSCEGLAAA